MESHPNFKFKRGDVIVPKPNVDVPDYLRQIEITDVRPAHCQYKGRDMDGDILSLSPSAIENDFELKVPQHC